MAQSDMFLKVTGQRTGEILGESNDRTFTNQIELIDWTWGMKSPSSVGGQPTGRRQLAELKVVKRADRASTALMSVLSTNELLTSVVLSVRKSGGTGGGLAYFKVTLEKARVIEYTVQSDITPSGSPTLTERLSFTFQVITVDYTPQLAAGGGGGGTSFTDTANPNA